MKPGMQRDILVAYWLLFDEFEIGDDNIPQIKNDRHRKPQENGTQKSEPAKPGPKNGRTRRGSTNHSDDA